MTGDDKKNVIKSSVKKDAKKVVDGNITDEKTSFVPIIATAMKIDDDGNKIGKEELIQINIPMDDDIKIVKRKLDNKDKTIVNSHGDDILNSNKQNHGKINKNVGENIMEEKDVENLINERMNNVEFQKKIDEINSRSADLVNKFDGISKSFNKKTDDITGKIDNFNKTVNTQFNNNVEANKEAMSEFDKRINNVLKSQEESCNGVDCIKSTVDELKNENSDIKDVLKNINDRTDNVLCSGPNGCNSGIPKGSSFCPNCGVPIKAWKGIAGWTPYDKRK